VGEDIRLFVESLIGRYGIVKVVTTPYLLVPFIAGLGLFRNRSTASLLGAAATFVISLLVIVFLSLQLRRERGIRAERERIIARYTEAAYLDGPVPYEWENWQETIQVTRHGDSIIEQWLTAKVIGEKPLHVLWFAQYQSEGTVVRDSQRRRVQVRISSFSEETGNRTPGARYDTTYQWGQNKLRVYLHFDQPIQPGSIVRLYVRWVWPAYYAHVLDGNVDKVEWSLRWTRIRQITSTVTFDKHCHLDGRLTVRAYEGSPVPRVTPQNGNVTVVAEYSPGDVQRKVGYWLDGSRP